jgi:hypothetical protein
MLPPTVAKLLANPELEDNSNVLTAYNKIDGFVPTLVGNWVEVRSLGAGSLTRLHRMSSCCLHLNTQDQARVAYDPECACTDSASLA